MKQFTNNKELKETFLESIKPIFIHPNQGYAFYLRYNGLEVENCNGVLNVNEHPLENITSDSHFRLASVTKQFIACGIIRLVKSGKITFNTCVRDIFPELPDYFNKIQVINLLNHTSGILDYEDWEHEENAPQVLDHEIIDFLKETKETYFEIGSQYRYSNTAYVLLADIIEKVSGEKLDEYMKKEVFDKAHLQDTIVNYQGITQIPHRAMGHIVSKKNNELVMKDQYWCSATIGDGGIYSTVNDLKRWIDFYLSEEANFLKDTLFSKQREVEKNKNNTYYYGMGMRTVVLENGKEIYYHCGSTIGTNTIVIFSRDYDLKCIFLTNAGHTDTSFIKDAIIDLLK